MTPSPIRRIALSCSLLSLFVSLPALAQRIKPYNGEATPQPGTSQATTQVSLGEFARNVREKKRARVKVSPEEAQQIFKAVDEISEFAAEDSGLVRRTKVKRQMVGQSEVERLMKESSETAEEKAERQRGVLAMKKFGLLPRDFDVEGFASKLMGESVAGFYDPKTKQVSLLNWVELEEQKAVLSHELTHALQDQNYDLLKWHKQHRTKATGADKSVVSSETDEGESASAAQCVIEGQAMLVMFDYLLAPYGTSLARSPGLIESVREVVSYGAEGPVLHAAPLIVREGMGFPYKEGLTFETELLERGKQAMAFTGALQNPPVLTHQILQPRLYLAKEKISPVRIPDLKPALGESVRVQDSGVIGELDTRVFLHQYESNWVAKELAKYWRGASYATVALTAEGQPTTTKDVGLIYVSRWATPESAEKYADFYVRAVGKRYSKAETTANWMPAPSKAGQPLSATQVLTEEGAVIVELWGGNQVVVTESFEAEQSAKVRDAVLGVGPSTKAQAAMSNNDLTLRLVAMPELAPVRNAVHESAVKAVMQAAREASKK